MTLRLAKIALIFGIAIYYTIVVLNNLADHDSNLQVVRHVLLMDTTFPGNRGMWRALRNPRWHVLFFLAIVVWEVLTGFLCWWDASAWLALFAAVPPRSAKPPRWPSRHSRQVC